MMQVPQMERAKSFMDKPSSAGKSGKELSAPPLDIIRRCNSFTNANTNTNVKKDRIESGNSDSSGSLSFPKRPFSSKPKFKMKEKTKILLKLHVIREKALAIDQMLKDLRSMTDNNQELDHHLQESFAHKIVLIDTEVKMARKLLIFLCKHRPLQRHYSALEHIQDQMRPTFDISVQFFGIDWDHIFRVSCCCIRQIDEMIEKFQGEDDVNFEIDVILPSNIMRNLATIEADICSHAEAVLKGRLSEKHQQTITEEQNRHAYPPMLQLHRIAQNDRTSLEGVKSGTGIWSELRRQVQFGVLMRHFRRPSARTSDDLWRMWYTGVQSVTLSVSMMAASNPNGAVAMDNNVSGNSSIGGGNSRRASVSAREKLQALRQRVRGSFSQAGGRSPTATSPTPSSVEQEEILGSYTSSLLTGTTKKEAKKMNKMLSKDAELLELVDFAEAPRQKLEDHEL